MMKKKNKFRILVWIGERTIEEVMLPVLIMLLIIGGIGECSKRYKAQTKIQPQTNSSNVHIIE